ncbi:hypothetical protein F5Y09DRAFT_351846 [Xylaria sp. FL1042]|nr:hypothetical protein F5Y09DRAFT_351846 [Xylaria sp. FL1042]
MLSGSTQTPPWMVQEGAWKMEENLKVCRHLFGLGDDPLPVTRGRQGGRGRWLGPWVYKSHFRDVLLVSIHISGCLGCDTNPLLLGVSILDPRHLQSYIDSKGTATPDIITSHQFQLVKNADGKPKVFTFSFGDTVVVEEKSIATYLDELLGPRHYVLVSYNGGAVKLVLPEHQYFLPRTLDILNLTWRPRGQMRLAGNYARLVLHALLMTLVKDWNCRKDVPKTKPPRHTRRILSSLKAVAKAWEAPELDEPLELEGLFRVE